MLRPHGNLNPPYSPKKPHIPQEALAQKGTDTLNKPRIQHQAPFLLPTVFFSPLNQ